ncbi:MAG: Hsp20/alpha crystallin family protein [Pirellulaceae bacterium]|nr:Hsp20/alpha crystallin family protein [Pirellulaceae bacterium]
MSRTQVPARRNGPFEDFSSDMERVFDSVLGRTFGTMLRNGSSEKFLPTIDLAETPDAFEISVDLPGIKPEEVKLEMHDGQLVISGKREETTDRKEKNYHYTERARGSFVRSVVLPSEIDTENIDAQYEHGVLRVKLPKSAKAQPRKIEIKAKG